MIEFEDVNRILTLHRVKLLDSNKVADLLNKVGESNIEKIIKFYNDVMIEEGRKELDWFSEEDNTGIPRYDELDFDDICTEVVWRIRRSNKT